VVSFTDAPLVTTPEICRSDVSCPAATVYLNTSVPDDGDEAAATYVAKAPLLRLSFGVPVSAGDRPVCEPDCCVVRYNCAAIENVAGERGQILNMNARIGGGDRAGVANTPEKVEV
jgi:hypothetical protein